MQSAHRKGHYHYLRIIRQEKCTTPKTPQKQTPKIFAATAHNKKNIPIHTDRSRKEMDKTKNHTDPTNPY
ncbi:hypothetical protein VTJ04DRAFT_9177 [Mycothermus thermophilus]|uniref:uncharacterized protein n=1 Tax=Humicola insolens TaxID=85995 RepID=UPI0037447272